MFVKSVKSHRPLLKLSVCMKYYLKLCGLVYIGKGHICGHEGAYSGKEGSVGSF